MKTIVFWYVHTRNSRVKLFLIISFNSKEFLSGMDGRWVDGRWMAFPDHRLYGSVPYFLSRVIKKPPSIFPINLRRGDDGRPI